ncbi:MAG: EAL domain-containing protein [Phycisphaeraceae bacterium]|nr:EAL domain-containing protein [Phycisphaeraceae bacterium]
MNALGFGAMIVDAETHHILAINQMALNMLGLQREQVIGRICHKFVCPAEKGQCPVTDLGKTLDRSERTLCSNGGSCLPILKSVTPVEVHGRKLLLESLVDISAQKQAQESLRASEQRFALAAKGANDGLWDWNLLTHQVYYSPRWKQMLGYADQDIEPVLDAWISRVHPDDLLQFKTDLDRHLQGQSEHFQNEHRILHHDGEYRWMLSRGQALMSAEGKPIRMAGSQTDITEHKRTLEELRRGAFYDSLTGLANRALLLDRLDQCIARAQRHLGYQFAVLFLDLDHFKVVNDSLGHQVGDQLLIAVAERLHQSLRSSDTIARTDLPHTVARMGGDEFTILLEDIRQRDDAVRVAERIQKLLTRPLLVNGQEVFTAASIGIATYDGSVTSADAMLRDADTALYRAKGEGRGRFALFDKTMHAQAVERLAIERELRRAIELKQLHLVYQPIVQLIDERIVGFEALIRWHHPQRGDVPPAQFVPVAEEMGLIVPIGRFVLQQAIGQMKLWQQCFPADPPLSIAVNLSSHQIRQGDLVDHIMQFLHESDLSPASLHLEITESALLENDQHTIETLAELKRRGISLHLDDFGTGYSSLSYLHQFPIDVVKIDRTFIRELDETPDRNSLVASIVAMAHNMGLRVVAEGIETATQLARLKSMSCQLGQGYYLARPLSVNDAEQLLIRDRIARPLAS